MDAETQKVYGNWQSGLCTNEYSPNYNILDKEINIKIKCFRKKMFHPMSKAKRINFCGAVAKLLSFCSLLSTIVRLIA